MRFGFKTMLLGAAALFAFAVSTPVRAETFFVEDQTDNFSIAFPDLWKLGQNQKPDDKLTIIAPGTNDLATCRVRVRDDRRFVIYPPKYGSSIQKVAFSKAFWDNYLGEYDDVTVDAFKDEAGIGRAHASVVEATYTTAEGTIARKRGIMFAGLYRDSVYIVDCSAEETVYDRWRPEFMGIIKSVDSRKEIHETTSGEYRPFLNDELTIINGPDRRKVYRF